jgi:predicted O-methyltransferase YrrM
MIKQLLPTGAKDLAKRMINASLAPLGWKLAPAASVVLEGSWYDSPVDGVVTRHRPPSLDDPNFRETIQHLAKRKAFAGLAAAGRGETALQRLYLAGQLARSAHAIAGDFVEFGTYRGATAYCMLRATDRLANPKPIFLYDTFSGIPTDGMTQHEQQVGLAGAHSDTSVSIVAENLAAFEHRVSIRPGLIPATLDDTGPQRIAMMHVDLNLAQPTIAALRWADRRWSPGGVCLLDDYLWEGYEDQRASVEAFFAERGLTIIAFPTGQGIVWNLGRNDVAVTP